MSNDPSRPDFRGRSNSTLTEYLKTGRGKIPSIENSGVELKGETVVVGESMGA